MDANKCTSCGKLILDIPANRWFYFRGRVEDANPEKGNLICPDCIAIPLPMICPPKK